MLEVVGVQTAGGPAAGHRTRGVAVLEAAQAAVDLAGGAPGADGDTVAFEPHLVGGITAEVLAFGLGQHRTQMQRGGGLVHIQVHDHGGVLAVRAAGHIGVPAGLDQRQECFPVARQRRPRR
ncbi:hypothetical protein A5661_03175 [Mycobacterium asiaticum]|nr:hypothetical protein A5661_03175 [Mycobacterium asiaticum]